jgi:HSP20 family protein
MTMMEPFAPWLRDLNRFMTGESAPAAFMPPADVLVSESGVTVHMDVPGLRSDDLDIELENDTLTIRGERRFPYQAEGEERVWRHIERRFGRFERSLRVPGGLDPDAVEASIADGVLTLSIPRPEALKPHRVQIQSAAGNGQQSKPDIEVSTTTEASTGTEGSATTKGTAPAA